MYFTNEEMKNAETFANARDKMDDSMFPSYLRVGVGDFTDEEKELNKSYEDFLSDFSKHCTPREGALVMTSGKVVGILKNKEK